MKCIYIIIFLYLFKWSCSQTRFNVNLPCGTDTVLDVGIKVIETHDGKFLSCGVSSHPFINYQAAYLVKTDSLGNLIWKKQYNFSAPTTYSNNGTDMFRDVVELPDSNYLLLGITTNTITNDDDVFLCKIDTAGNLLWFKKYMHPDDDESNAFKLTSDGKVIILGYAFSSGTYSDVLLIKTDLNGNLIWRKRFGNIYDEKYYSIEIIKNNTEYLLGGDYGYYNTGNPYYDMSLMRTDTTGNILWQQQYGISPDESGKCAIPTLDSGYAICGMYNDTGVVLKTNKNGVVQWIKKFSLEPSSVIYQLKQLQDSSYVMIKSDIDWQNTNRTGSLMKADKNGNLLWQRIYPHPTSGISNYFFGFNTTADKGFIMTGQYNRIGQPYQNMWLVKTDSLGCDSVSCSYLVTGAKETHLANTGNLVLYPNPNSGSFKIHIWESENTEGLVSVSITNLIGQTVFNQILNKTSNSEIEIKEGNLCKGIYIVSLLQNNKSIGKSKLVIE